MTFKIADVVLASAVATNGTFTVTYPAGTGAGTYAGAWNHAAYAEGLQKLLLAPTDFTISFGASNATVTYLGTTSIPANTKVKMQLEISGSNDTDNPVLNNNQRLQRPANVKVVDLGSPVTAVSTAVAASQSVTGAGTAFVLNGTLVSNSVAVFDTPRNVVAAWTGTAVLTIKGKDVDGNAVTENSASGTSHTGKKAFKSVTSVTTSASITSATVGNGNVIGLPVFLFDASFVVRELMDSVALPLKAGKVTLPYMINQVDLLAPTAQEVVSPVAGFLARHQTSIQAAVTTGGTLAVAVNGGTATVGLTQTIANAATKGTRQSVTPTTRHGADTVVAVGDRITITPASFATAGAVNGQIEFDTGSLGQLDGTIVAGVTSAATATTGDTRGTYAPTITPDGTHGYLLLIVEPDPANAGVPQFSA